MKIRFRPYTLQLKHPFGLASGTRNSTDIVLLELEHNGIVGFGEASLPPYYPETQKTVMDFLSRIKMESFQNPLEIEKILQHVDLIAPGNNAAKAAVDIALHDLAGKISGKPCYKMFGIKSPETKPTSVTIAMDKISSLPQKIKEVKDFKILKIKLGTRDDEKIVHIVINETDKPLYADANKGWADKNQALEMIFMLNENGFEIVEQPMPVDCDEEDMMWLKEKSPLTLIADESVKRFSDLEKASQLFHGVNIKLMKCTGMAEAFKMIKRAKELNLKIMIGCMTETSCAVLAAAHLAPLADYVDLDGPFLITNNPFKNPVLENGCLIISENPGIGLELN